MWKVLSVLLACLTITATPLKKDNGGDSANPGSGAGPRLIMIIRHGEKPEGKDDPNLSPKGYERAGALAKVIPDDFAKPDFLFATKKSKDSVRPIETLTPLSKAIDEPINEQYSDDEVAELAHEILTNPKYNGKVMLIAWHHGKIPQLAKNLGATDAPPTWNGKVFDRVWELTYSAGSVQFSNLPQKALPGDSDQ